MRELLEWLLGLERIRLDGAWPDIELASPPAPWAMLAGVVLVLLLVSFAYRFERGGGPLKVMLAAVRVLIILAVLGLMAQPQWVVRRERVDPSVIAVLTDVSASMARNDAADTDPAGPLPPADAPRPTRLARCLEVLSGPGGGLLARLEKSHRVELWSFATTAQRLARAAEGDAAARLAALQPAGHGTDLVSALDRVLADTQGARLAGIIVLSDGRQTVRQPLDRLLEEARQRQVPVHSIAVGSPHRFTDAEVLSVAADENVFRKDIVSVAARLRFSGPPPAAPVEALLVDAASGAVLDRAALPLDVAQPTDAAPSVTADDDGRTLDVELRFRPAGTGRAALRVEVPPLPGESERSNNAVDLVVQVHDEKLRVLYVEGPARFEYRFLKNTLMREPTIQSSCLLLDATPAFVQEGTEPIRRFPVSPGELDRYDVVLLGDVDPRGDWISPAQLAMLSDFVALGGGGLGFIAGERAAPHRFRASPLEALLPVRIDPQPPSPARRTSSFSLRPTPLGRRHPLLRFEVDPAHNDATLADLPGWFWNARVAGPKPAAEVLAVHPVETTAEGPMPLIVLGRVGAGRTLFVGSDDVWRWRRGEGEAYYDTFWLNAMRVLAGGRRAGGAEQRWRLESDRRFASLDQPVTFRAVARDAEAAEGVAQVPLRLEDASGAPVAQIALKRTDGTPPTFEGALWPRRAGAFTAVAVLPGAQPPLPSRSLVVSGQDPETRRPEADPALLQSLAQMTGGVCVAARDAASLVPHLPDRSVRIADDLVEPLWDSTLVLAAVIVLLTAEWSLRKLKGLS